MKASREAPTRCQAPSLILAPQNAQNTQRQHGASGSCDQTELSAQHAWTSSYNTATSKMCTPGNFGKVLHPLCCFAHARSAQHLLGEVFQALCSEMEQSNCFGCMGRPHRAWCEKTLSFRHAILVLEVAALCIGVATCFPSWHALRHWWDWLLVLIYS
jgi:hypothetical protein